VFRDREIRRSIKPSTDTLHEAASVQTMQMLSGDAISFQVPGSEDPRRSDQVEEAVLDGRWHTEDCYETSAVVKKCRRFVTPP
jgi:hypothetical protein